MTGDFIEPRQELAGISQHYRERILPQLQSMESDRKRAHGQAMLIVPAVILFALIGSFVLFRKFNSPEFLFWGVGLSFMGGFGLYAYLMRKVRGDTKNVLVGEVAKYLGWEFSSKASEPQDFEAYKNFKMVPGFNRSSFEDRLSGVGHGANFSMVEAHLERKGDKSYHTVFRGFLLEIDFHQPFQSTTLVLRDRGLFNRKKFKNLKRVGMASSKWEKLFEAYGTDQVEARVKLDPAFMEKLMELEESVDGKKIRFGFFDNRLHVVCETKNRYEPGPMMKPLTDPSRMQNLIDEVDALYGVIDAVVKRPNSDRPRDRKS